MSDKVRVCPFCDYDEGWVKDRGSEYVVECKVCHSCGPVGKTHDEAVKLWNGSLKNGSDDGMLPYENPYLQEDAMGGVSAPMSTLNNTPGVGNVVPASQAATTGAQFSGDAVKGSGDRYDTPDDKKSKSKSKKNKGGKKKSKGRQKIMSFGDFLNTQK